MFTIGTLLTGSAIGSGSVGFIEFRRRSVIAGTCRREPPMPRRHDIAVARPCVADHPPGQNIGVAPRPTAQVHLRVVTCL
ncbi:hypothetical protein GCM10007298_40200 [Williamsia phyllosphaerae]|uniref:Secreted protein n=1 Tax=Williamsia phyllosphaerae TaxID=885042 RepID=A0ABQ1V607_9NOCA|nr:hypothetical protein GCM10007298_40200 [Williamsia phyllosphaerae]